MVDAERRLLANALTDQDNQYFALISESYVPFLKCCHSNYMWIFNHTHEHVIYSETAHLTTYKVWYNAWGQCAVVCITMLHFSSLVFWCCCRCVPLYNFTFIYDYLLGANMSFVDWWALQQVIAAFRRVYILTFISEDLICCCGMWITVRVMV